jgi:glycosyltransferase involved in cell wall biosynthesis
MKFGGEAALPTHYFRVLRQRGIETWLVVHERTRTELMSYFAAEFDRIHFIPDTIWHRLLCWPMRILPKRVYDMTFGLALTLLTQVMQRRLVKRLVQSQKIDVVHQPIFVSPKAPSLIFDVGVPVVMGPMNGGMNYPPAFRHLEGRFVIVAVRIGRLFSNFMNRLMPGKQRAATLLVANPRTRQALPQGVRGRVIELVENGVDVSLWQPKQYPAEPEQAAPEPTRFVPTRFVYVGRLVDWKAIDLLLIAFKQVQERVPATLDIIGDGAERSALEQQARELGLLQPSAAIADSGTPEAASPVRFLGWMSQSDCAQHLQQMDALVLPSLFECGGAVVLEAMAVSLPVVTTNWGGPTDYVNETCGILVDPTSPAAFVDGLTAAMVRLAESPSLRAAMGTAGRQRVLEHFDWEKKVDRILEVYAETLAREVVSSGASSQPS